MSAYLPKDSSGSSSSVYTEGGGLYALGLIHANHGGAMTGRNWELFYIFPFLIHFMTPVISNLGFTVQITLWLSARRPSQSLCDTVPVWVLVWLLWELDVRIYTNRSNSTCSRTMPSLVSPFVAISQNLLPTDPFVRPCVLILSGCLSFYISHLTRILLTSIDPVLIRA